MMLAQLVALAAALSGPRPAAAQCLTSGTSWKNTPMAAPSAVFGVSFDATPSMTKLDGVTGLSNGPASGFSSLAVIVRFNNLGYIDARNGGSYAAAASIPYSAGLAYHVRLAVDPTRHSYSVYVTSPGRSEQTLASNYAFRTEQALASTLNNWALYADSGSHQVCGFTLAGGRGTVSPPTVTFTAPAAGATVSGAVTLAAAASSPLGIANVQFQVDGANLGSAVSVPPYAAAWNTASASNASHTLGAVATDTAGTRAAAAKSVTVSNVVQPPPPSGCVTAGPSWQNASFPAQTAAFGASFDATPVVADMDGVTGLALNAAAGFSSLAAAVRFNSTGYIDVRNAASYAAAVLMPYTPGKAYHVRLAVDPVSHTYSVFVTPPGGAETTLASGYAFRTDQTLTSSLNDWALFADAGTHQVCNFALSAGPGPLPDTTPPAVAVTAPKAGAALSGTAAVSGTAADNAGVASTALSVDGGPLAPCAGTTSWSCALDTTKLTNAAHTLTAQAKDAAGNAGTASVPVTVNNPATTGLDKYGVKMLYPTNAAGQQWYNTWDDGVSRSFGYAVDPKDPWFDAAHGDASYYVDGKGLFTISGTTPRMYIHDPALTNSWRDVEMTVYAMRVSDDNTTYAGFQAMARSNHATYPAGISDTTDLCDTRGIGARMRHDGTLDFVKETSHPDATAVASKLQWPGGLPYNVWIGYKYVVYDLANGDVMHELWLDTTDGAGGGTWTKVDSIEDTGKNIGVGGVSCASGIDPALRLTNSDARPGSESGKPNISVYWRSTNIGSNGLVYKKMSVRSILAP